MKINISRGFSTPARHAVIEALRFLMVFALAMAAFAALGSVSARAENADISLRRAAERTDFTNDEVKDGFFKIAFGAELQLDARADRVRKFDEPIRIFVESTGLPDRRSEVAAVVADIRLRVKGL